MRYRKLGKIGYEVSEIGYGAWGIGGNLWQGGTDDESLRALRRAIDLGVTSSTPPSLMAPGTAKN